RDGGAGSAAGDCGALLSAGLLRAALGLPSPSSSAVGGELGRERWALGRQLRHISHRLEVANCDIKIASSFWKRTYRFDITICEIKCDGRSNCASTIEARLQML